MTNLRPVINDIKNGKYFANKKFSIWDYMRAIEKDVLSSNKLPKQLTKPKAQNKTQEIIDEIINTIRQNLYERTDLLETYEKETPLNKLAYWGALFDSLLEFFSYQASNQFLSYDIKTKTFKRACPLKYEYVHKSDYADIPVRFRDGLKKGETGYIVAKEQPKYGLVFKNDSARHSFDILVEEAKKLLPVLYSPETYTNSIIINSYFEEDEYFENFKIKKFKKINPNKENIFYQQLITDEQLSAYEKLKGIILTIVSLFYYIERKSNAQTIFKEYEKYKHAGPSKGFLSRAQSFTRTEKQLLVSMKKAQDFFKPEDIESMEKQLQNYRSVIMENLHDKIKTNIQ